MFNLNNGVSSDTRFNVLFFQFEVFGLHFWGKYEF